MEIAQAYELVAQACRRFQGTLDDHVNLQAALRALSDALGIQPTEPAAEAAPATNGDATPNRQQRRASKSG